MLTQTSGAILKSFLNSEPMSGNLDGEYTCGKAVYFHGKIIAIRHNKEIYISSSELTGDEYRNSIFAVKRKFNLLMQMLGLSPSVEFKQGKWSIEGNPWDGAWLKVS